MTASWKWLRIGQPAVVSETTTSTMPSSAISIERTMSSSTIERRSSGSITPRQLLDDLFGVGSHGCCGILQRVLLSQTRGTGVARLAIRQRPRDSSTGKKDHRAPVCGARRLREERLLLSAGVALKADMRPTETRSATAGRLPETQTYCCTRSLVWRVCSCSVLLTVTLLALRPPAPARLVVCGLCARSARSDGAGHGPGASPACGACAALA